MASVAQSDLWRLIPGGRQVDPDALTRAIERQIESGDLDFRTRLLIRDSLEALARHWGDERVGQWIDRSAHPDAIRSIRGEDLGEPGFPSLAWRVMEPTRPESIFQFLEELGARLRSPSRIYIGGSAPLIVSQLLTKSTDDIDVVDELPPELRNEHALLGDLAKRYGLSLTHFQSHYLPTGWKDRCKSLGRFGALEAHLVDAYDVCVSKLFSSRTKDLDDLRHLKHALDKEKLTRRLLDSAAALRGEEKLRKAAEMNWRILFGEPLPD